MRGLTNEVSRPPKADRLDRRVRPDGFEKALRTRETLPKKELLAHAGRALEAKRLETRAVIAGEARRNGQTPKAEPLRWAKRWNKCGPA